MQGLREQGEDVDPVLAQHGLQLDKLDPSTRIDRVREMQIYADLAAVLRNPLSGLRAGSHFAFAGYGPLIMLLMTCANSYEAFQLGVRYQQLTFLYGTLRFEPGAGESALVLVPLPLPDRVFRFRVDGEVAGTYKLLRDMQSTLGMDIHARRIDMPYPRPPEALAYEEHFGCPVQFGESQARFWVRNEDLQRRFPTADAAAHAMYRTLCDRQLVEQQAELSALAERVLAHLSLFADHLPAAADVARSFGLSERSLRRQLADEGTSLRELVARARSHKARELLRTSKLSVEAIALQLGYAEPAAFIHAFQRWEGCSPAAWRRAQAGA